MYFNRQNYVNDMEILVTQANLVAFSGTVVPTGITANADGKKLALSGSLIDADGRVVKQTGSAGSETLSSAPVGVLYKTVDLTNGDMPCSLIVEGYLRADRVLDGFAAAAITAIKTALPNIKFR